MIRATIAAIAAYTAVTITNPAAVPTQKTEQPTGVIVEDKAVSTGQEVDAPLYFTSPIELQGINDRLTAIEHDHEPAPTHDGESRVSSSVWVLHPDHPRDIGIVETNSGGTQVVGMKGPAKVNTRPTSITPVGERWIGKDGVDYVSLGGNRDFARAGTAAAAAAVAEANKPRPKPVVKPVVQPTPVVVSQPVIVQPTPRVERSVCRQRSGCPNGVCPRRSVVRRRLFRRW